jgi:hypothetical protein
MLTKPWLARKPKRMGWWTPRKVRRQFAENRIMIKAITTGFTFRFREW